MPRRSPCQPRRYQESRSCCVQQAANADVWCDFCSSFFWLAGCGNAMGYSHYGILPEDEESVDLRSRIRKWEASQAGVPLISLSKEQFNSQGESWLYSSCGERDKCKAKFNIHSHDSLACTLREHLAKASPERFVFASSRTSTRSRTCSFSMYKVPDAEDGETCCWRWPVHLPFLLGFG